MKLGTIILVATIALPGTAAYSQTPTPANAAAKQNIGYPTSKQKAARIRKGPTTGRAVPNTPTPRQGAEDPSSQYSAPNHDDDS